MTIDIARLTAAPIPSPLLRHLAGDAAEALARVWPAPHLSYLTASAPRRHLLGMALAEGVSLEGDSGAAALGEPIGHAIRLLLPKVSPGVKRALGRMGETGWPLESYRRFLGLLEKPETAKALRHMTTLDPAKVDRLAETPAGLLKAGLARFDLDAERARTARDCFAALVERDGLDRAVSRAREWTKARTAKGLFRLMGEDLKGPFAPPPFPDTPRLRWLASQTAIRHASVRYGNCLMHYLGMALTGELVFGEWLENPGAIFQIRRDWAFGWRLDQARGRRNEGVEEHTRAALGAELRQLGIRVGISGDDLRAAAARAEAGEARNPFLVEDHERVFG